MEKITSYKQIPKFTNEGVYHVDMSPAWLIKWIQEEETTMGLEFRTVERYARRRISKSVSESMGRN